MVGKESTARYAISKLQKTRNKEKESGVRVPRSAPGMKLWELWCQFPAPSCIPSSEGKGMTVRQERAKEIFLSLFQEIKENNVKAERKRYRSQITKESKSRDRLKGNPRRMAKQSLWVGEEWQARGPDRCRTGGLVGGPGYDGPVTRAQTKPAR